MYTDIVQTWTDDIVPNFSVPPTLHPWQADTISLLLSGENVALCVPTGSGKTLPQLTASLFFADGVAIVIPPLLSIEYQMETICKDWNIPFCNISSTPPSEIVSSLKSADAKVIIASIEKISDVKVQKAIQNIKVNYVAVDECQVMDSENGWTTFRPYVPLTWNYLRANFRSPFLLSSATMEEDSLMRIAESLYMARVDIKTVFKNPDRPNIYQQRRVFRETIDVGNIDEALGFLLPVIADTNFSKCQIFSTSKHLNDIVGRSAPHPSLKNALIGDNCLRSGTNKLFTLTNPDRDYSDFAERFECLQLGCDLDELCDCAACKCCSECNSKCSCEFAVSDPNKVMERILGLGDDNYRATQELFKSRRSEEEISSDEEEGDASEDNSDDEEPRRDELELSLVDLTPQFASFFSNNEQ